MEVKVKYPARWFDFIMGSKDSLTEGEHRYINSQINSFCPRGYYLDKVEYEPIDSETYLFVFKYKQL